MVSRFRAATIVAPTAALDPSAAIGEGAQLCDFSYIGSLVRIGRHFQCNVRSHVHHDSVIGDFVTFSFKTLFLGTVHIGDGVFVGAGAVLCNRSPDRPLRIGQNAVIGMGAWSQKTWRPEQRSSGILPNRSRWAARRTAPHPRSKSWGSRC